MTDAFHMIIDTLRRVDPKGGLLVFALLSSVYAAFRGKNKAQRMLGAASLVLTALFVFPPAAAVLARFMRGGQVYWRFLWTVPSIQLTALLGTEAAAHPKRRAGRILALPAVCAILVLAGRCVYQPGTFQKAENREKLDRLTIETANLINANAEQTGNSYRRSGRKSVRGTPQSCPPSGAISVWVSRGKLRLIRATATGCCCWREPSLIHSRRYTGS